jgi:hypothetical protein
MTNKRASNSKGNDKSNGKDKHDRRSLRLGRSQSARTASLRMTIFGDVVEGYEVFSG